MVSPYEIPEFETEKERSDFYKTPADIAYLKSEKYRELMTHIKIKSKMQLSEHHVVDTNEYLLSTALAISPYMNVCASGHTSFTNAEIHHKKVIGEFAEVLRKKDSNTCLRDLLIRKLEDIIENNEYFESNSIDNSNMNSSLKRVKEHDKIANKLPKDISTKNIIHYGEKLRDTDKTIFESPYSR